MLGDCVGFLWVLGCSGFGVRLGLILLGLGVLGMRWSELQSQGLHSRRLI